MSKQDSCVFCRVPEVEIETDDGIDDDLASITLSQVQKANEEWQINDVPWYVASQDEQIR